jgi:hypothetical protein
MKRQVQGNDNEVNEKKLVTWKDREERRGRE